MTATAEAPPVHQLILKVGGVSPRHSEPHMDEVEYRLVLGSWATGVSVITSMSHNGPRGLTANAFTSLSLDPMQLLVCFDLASNTLEAVRESGRFAVNVLGQGQVDISRRFATKAEEDQKFIGVAYDIEYETPVIRNCLAHVVCVTEHELTSGDHAIVIGRPISGQVDIEGTPLVFFRRGYWHPSPFEERRPIDVGAPTAAKA